MPNQRKTLTAVVVSIVILSLLMPVGTARAWEQPTHSQINFEAVDLFMETFNSSDMKKYDLGGVEAEGWNEPLRGIAVESSSLLQSGYRIGERSLRMRQWIALGGDWADEPHLFASVRHFYDPLALWGAPYLTDQYEYHGWYDDPKIDARTWGLDHPDNPFSFESALYYYKAAMETPEEDWGGGPRLTSGHWKLDLDLAPRDAADQRAIHLAMAYRALGEAMHLLGDMTQPAHVRNDSHPMDEPIEQALKSDDVRAAARTPVVDAHIAGSLLSAGGSLQSPKQLFDAVARFTNEHFYSADTIYDAAQGVLPQNIEPDELLAGSKLPYPAPQFEDLVEEEATVQGFITKRTVKRYSAPLINDTIPVAQQRLSFHWFDPGMGWKAKAARAWNLQSYHVPPSFADQQARALVPVAIHACADLMHLFYPTLELKADYQDRGVTEAGGGGGGGQERTVIEVDGEMVHHVAEDPAWQELGLSIAYDGPAKLVFARAGEVLKTRDLHFLDGRLHKIQNHEGQMVEEPLRVYLAERGGVLPEAEAFYQAEKREGDAIYLEIQAGSRTFRSEPFGFEDEESVEVSIQPPRQLVLELAAGATEAQHDFEAVASPDGAYRFDWDFGDGETFSEERGAGASSRVSHTYTGLRDGDAFYPTVRLYGEDGQFLAEDAVSIVVTVAEGSPTLTPTTATAAAGNWVLQEIITHQEVFQDSDSYPSHSFTIGDGSYASSKSWTDAPSGITNPAHGSFSFNGTWSPPPSYLKVGEDVTLVASIQGTASTVGDGYRNASAEVAVWYTEDPIPDCLGCSTYGSTDIVRAGAGGSSTDYPVSGSGEGSFTVPEGRPGDVLVIVAHGFQPGGRGQIVYKYVYDGTETPPERASAPQADAAPESDVSPTDPEAPTDEATATRTPSPPPSPTPPHEEPADEEQPGAGSGDEVTLTVVNASDATIWYLYVIPSSTDSHLGWGEDWLGSDVLFPGDTIEVTLPPDVYDLAATDEDEVFVDERYGVEITGDTTWTITGGPSAGAGDPVILEIVNRSGVDIWYLYVVDLDSDHGGSWGEDWLGSNLILNGESRRIQLAPGTYGVLAADEENVSVETIVESVIDRDTTWTVTGVLEPSYSGPLHRRVRATCGLDYDYEAQELIDPRPDAQFVFAWYVAWPYRGFAPGTEYEYRWMRDGEELGTYQNVLAAGAGEAVDFYAADAGAQTLLPSGMYEYWAKVGGEWVVYARCTIH